MLDTHCPSCHQEYQNVQHPLKPPGVIMVRSCACRGVVEIKPGFTSVALSKGEWVVEVHGSTTVTAEDLWPDGDAPANPTATQAAAALRGLYERCDEAVLDLGIKLQVDVDGCPAIE